MEQGCSESRLDFLRRKQSAFKFLVCKDKAALQAQDFIPRAIPADGGRFLFSGIFRLSLGIRQAAVMEDYVCGFAETNAKRFPDGKILALRNSKKSNTGQTYGFLESVSMPHWS